MTKTTKIVVGVVVVGVAGVVIWRLSKGAQLMSNNYQRAINNPGIGVTYVRPNSTEVVNPGGVTGVADTTELAGNYVPRA